MVELTTHFFRGVRKFGTYRTIFYPGWLESAVFLVEHGGKSCLKLVILPGARIAMNNSPTDDLPLEPVAEWVNTGQLPQAPVFLVGC
jgi:hypothetical protein